MKSLKDCSVSEIHYRIDKAIEEIRIMPEQYGIIRIEISGGKVKFITVEKPV